MNSHKQLSTRRVRPTRVAGLKVRSGVRAGSDNPTRDHFQQWGWQSS